MSFQPSKVGNIIVEVNMCSSSNGFALYLYMYFYTLWVRMKTIRHFYTFYRLYSYITTVVSTCPQ